MSQIYKNSEGKYYKLPENHPIVSLIYVLLLIFAGTLLFSMIAIGVGYALYGPTILQLLPAIIAGEEPSKVNFIKIFQVLSSIGTFLIPTYFLMRLEKKRTTYITFSLPSQRNLLPLAVAVMIASIPLLELSILINLKMQLPEYLSGLEFWMKTKEEEMEKLTVLFLSTSTYKGLAFNLFVIAVMPAIGEELLFRGVIQNIFTRWMNNPHVAIWFVAILFSAIHMQFYGFLPRMLMGALFGYLYFWGKSIWLPILAHFVNNAYATIYSFILIKQGVSMDEINDTTASNWIFYVLSFIGTAIIIYYFWKSSEKERLKLKAI